MNDDFLCTLVQDPHSNVIFHFFAMCWDSTYPLFLFPGNRRKSMQAFSNPYYYGRANTWAIKHNGKEVVRATGLLSLLVIVSWISNTNKYHIYHKQFARYVSPHLSLLESSSLGINEAGGRGFEKNDVKKKSLFETQLLAEQIPFQSYSI